MSGMHEPATTPSSVRRVIGTRDTWCRRLGRVRQVSSGLLYLLGRLLTSFFLGLPNVGRGTGKQNRSLRLLIVFVWLTFLMLVGGRQVTLLVPLAWASRVAEWAVIGLGIPVVVLLFAAVAREGGLREGDIATSARSLPPSLPWSSCC